MSFSCSHLISIRPQSRKEFLCFGFHPLHPIHYNLYYQKVLSRYNMVVYSHIHLSLIITVDVIFLKVLKQFRTIGQQNHHFSLDHPIAKSFCSHSVSLQCCQVFIVNLQVYGQLFAKVLTLSRFWTLHMAIKFYHAMNFNAFVNSAIYPQVWSILIQV